MITGDEPIHSIHVPGFTYSDGSFETPYVKDGITIRQHFAAMAMQGLSANTEWAKTINDDWDNFKERLASAATDIADALISELNKSKN